MLYRDIWLEILPFINQNCLLLSIVYVPNVNIYITNFDYHLFSKQENINHVISIIYLNRTLFLQNVCKQSNIKLVQLMIDKKGTDTYWGLYYASYHGYMRITKMMINKYANCADYGFDGACTGSNIKIVKLIIKKSSYNWNEDNWNSGLEEACKNGHMKMVQLMIYKGANDWNSGLKEACRSGYMKIVQLMIQKGANDWYGGLYWACNGGHTKMVKLMIEWSNAEAVNIKEANTWNGGLRGSCNSGNMKIVRLMIHKGANDWNGGLRGSCNNGNMKIVRLMIHKGANDWNGGLDNACFGNHLDIIKLMIQRGATECYYCSKSIDSHLSKKRI